jgi:hypothetical protein
VALDGKSRPLTAFTCADGLYQFKRVPFGLKNAPSYFQRMMHQVLQDLVGKTCEVYIAWRYSKQGNSCSFLHLGRLYLSTQFFSFRAQTVTGGAVSGY